MQEDRVTSDPIDRALADVLVAAYKGRRLNQAYLVNATGIKPATMQRLMAGKSSFSIKQLNAIADAIGAGKTGAEYLREAEHLIVEPTPNVTSIR